MPKKKTQKFVTIVLDLTKDEIKSLKDMAKRYDVTTDDVIHDAILDEMTRLLATEKCKLHPTYKAIRRPTSKKKGCKCKLKWDLKEYVSKAEYKIKKSLELW